MIKIIGLSLSVLLCSLLIKNNNKVFATILSISGGVLLFIAISDKMAEIISSLVNISSDVSQSLSYIKLMVKVLGITLISQFTIDICRDNGESALASMTEISSKIIVVSMILPLFETIIKIVTGLLK